MALNTPDVYLYSLYSSTTNTEVIERSYRGHTGHTEVKERSLTVLYVIELVVTSALSIKVVVITIDKTGVCDTLILLPTIVN